MTVGIDPESGGALTRFDLKMGNTRFDILRRASDPKSGAPRALGASSFPMIPYAGRLREGRFEFEGRSIDYPLNALPERHSSHGDGFTRPWALTALERHRAVLELLPAAFAPIQYHCTQSIELAEDRLDVRFRIRNLESHRIPIGIGLHPYFAHRHTATLRAHLPVQWHWDAELMPTYAAPNARSSEFERGVAAADLPIAAQYCGWDGQAQIEWPAERVQVRLLTRPALAACRRLGAERRGFFLLRADQSCDRLVQSMQAPPRRHAAHRPRGGWHVRAVFLVRRESGRGPRDAPQRCVLKLNF